MLAILVWSILLALRAAEIAVFGALVATWLDIDPDNLVVRALRAVSDPLLRLVRPLARRIPGPFDWTPFLVIFGCQLLRTLLGA